MPDSVPNYLQTNADGSVTAEFSGGVIMPLQPDPGVIPDYQAGGSIAWTDGPGGAKLAYNVGTSNGAGKISNHLAARDGTSTPTNRFARVSAIADSVTNTATVEAYAKDPAGPASSSRTIIDSNNESDYLQLGASKRSSTFELNGTFPGGTNISNPVSVLHNWGLDTVAWTSVYDSLGVGSCYAQAIATTLNLKNFQVISNGVPVAGAPFILNVILKER